MNLKKCDIVVLCLGKNLGVFNFVFFVKVSG